MHNRLPVNKGVTALTLFSASLIPFTTAFAAPPENGTALTLPSMMSGIRANEIFQRALPQNSAAITLRVASKPPASSYDYYSISLLNAYGARQTVLAEGAYSGQDFLSFALPPQANFSQVRVSFYNYSGVESVRWDSPLFNVGEVFLVAGQSNAANHGYVGSTPWLADAKHRAIDPAGGGSWSQLQAQMPYTTSWAAPTNGSPWVSFAHELSAKLGGVPVALLNVAVGGSPLEWWQSGEVHDYFSRLTLAGATLSRLGAGGASTCSFRAVLWHQGESNAQRNLGENTNGGFGPPDRKWYAQTLTQVARDFRTQTGCAQPWMVASVSWLDVQSRINDNKDVATKLRAETEIREGQRFLWRHTPLDSAEPVFKAGPDTDLMNGETPTYGAAGYRFDGIHMSRAGLELHGKLWASRVASMINPALPVSAEKDLIPEAAVVWNAFANTLGRTAQEIELDNTGYRWWVQTKVTNPGVDVAAAMAGSDEKYVRDLFQNLLGRRPAWWESHYWVKQLADQATTRAALSGSNQVGYENTLSPNGKKMFRLYVNVMGRTLPEILQDAGGMAYWTSVLDNNLATETDIANNFRSSAEYRVRNAFVTSFSRQPSQAELNKYFSTIASYPTDAALAQAVWNNELP